MEELKEIAFKRTHKSMRAEAWIETNITFNLKAKIAEKLIDRFGLIAAKDNGEDSSGRQKASLMEPKEVVMRCCDLASLFVDEIKNRNWFLEFKEVEKD